jgi:hypothetical protein
MSYDRKYGRLSQHFSDCNGTTAVIVAEGDDGNIGSVQTIRIFNDDSASATITISVVLDANEGGSSSETTLEEYQITLATKTTHIWQREEDGPLYLMNGKARIEAVLGGAITTTNPHVRAVILWDHDPAHITNALHYPSDER